MKWLTILLTINSIACFGQDFFADNLKNYPWANDQRMELECLRKSKDVPLSILKISKDSLKMDRTISTFGDSLAISHYDSKQRMERLLMKFGYNLQLDKWLLNIKIDDTETLTYRLTFASTGSFVLLTRKKNKIRRSSK